MSRKAAFRQRDVARLVRTAQACGIKVGRIDVDAAGRISVFADGDESALSRVVNGPDPLDACPWLKS